MRPRVGSLVLATLLPLAGMFSDFASAQTNALPGVRGSLYESPTFGWVLIVPETAWSVASVESEGGTETVHLVSTLGDGADAIFTASIDDGRGAEGCVQDLIDSLAAAYEGTSLRGWYEPEIERDEFVPGVPLAHARVETSDDPTLDVLALIECKRGADRTVVGMTLLRTDRDLKAIDQIPLPGSLVPGERHTGRPRAGSSSGIPEEGVARFLGRNWPPLEAFTDPFSCSDQETFPRPPEAPPSGRGWFSCDGQIANIDTVPATIDLEQIALGCARVAADDVHPPGCPSAPVAPSHFEVLQAQGSARAGGPVITLAPGESIEVVLWYALPEGDPPLEVLYLEPDRTIVAGPTFFTSGSGSRPRVRVGR